MSGLMLRSLASLLAAAVFASGAPAIAVAQPTGAPAQPAAPPRTPTRISFGPAGPGQGSVTITCDGVRVSFDGRPFGVAPMTITNVPKGDYVIQGTTPDGKDVSRPVTIDENTEATVDLSAGLISKTLPGAAPPTSDSSGTLMKASRIMLGVSAAALVSGVVSGVLELKKHSDYESAPADQATLDRLAREGRRDAAIANVSFVACGASLLASGLLALPTYLKSEHPTEPTSLVFVWAGVRRSAMAGISIRF
jgi:hypothetical protein